MYYNSNSWISYKYFVQLNFDASLCRIWYSCFGSRLVFLIIFLSDMHLSDFLCAFLMNVIFRASRNDKMFSNKCT